MARLKALLLLTWPALLWGLVLVAFGRIGFNPTDEGFVNALSWRMLHGQVPHADLIWPRPMGSGYLHLPELLLPTPMVLTSRAVALAEVIGYSVLFAVLILDRPPMRWSMVEAVGVGASVLVNLNAFPMLTWYTVDGLLFVAAGAVLLRSALRRRSVLLVAAAFLALGVATTFKQSFWPAPAFGLVWLLMAASDRRQRIWYGVVALLAALVPAAAYVGVVIAAGGFDEMAVQLTGVQAVLGEDLFEALGRPAVLGAVVAGVAALGALSLLPWSPGGRLVVQVLMAAIVIGIVADGRLVIEGSWAIVLWWFVIAQAGAALLASGRIDWTALVLIGSGWMISLSYGVSTPNLIGGSMALFLLHRGLELPLSRPRPRRVTVSAAAMVILALVAVPMFAIARTEMVYRDRPAEQLTVDLGTVHPELAGVIGAPATAEYLSQARDCVADYPASRVALLPDAPILYAMFGLVNPMPIDWVIPLDMLGSEDRIVAAAQEIDRAGDYLVLFATVPANLLRSYDALEPGDSLAFRDPALGERLYSSFSGERVECGIFIGFWSGRP